MLNIFFLILHQFKLEQQISDVNKNHLFDVQGIPLSISLSLALSYLNLPQFKSDFTYIFVLFYSADSFSRLKKMNVKYRKTRSKEDVKS